MKKILFVVVLFAAATRCYAQDDERMFKKFKGEVSLGYAAFPGNSDIKKGFIFALEPKFAVLDQLAIGGRFETTLLGKEVASVNGYDEDDIKLKIYESFNVTADFYFTNNYNVRPFVGAGAGLYLVSSATSQYDYNTDDGTNTSTKFGGLIRAGVELRHFRIGIEYNLVPKSSASYDYFDTVSGNYITTLEESKNSYIGFKAGFCFGGGPRH